MLVPTMTNAEVHAEVLRDCEHLQDATLTRIHEEYYKERQRLKIDKAREYPRTYRIRTASKNNWIIVVTKAHDRPRHRTMLDQQAGAIVYYFAKEGYRFFRPQGAGKPMQMFYGHFFTRYNERMGLNLVNYPDIAAHFFSHSSAMMPFSFEPDREKQIPYVCKAGIALGERWDNPAWNVFKTFVNHDLKHQQQRQEEQKMQDMVQSVLHYIVNHMKRDDDDQYRTFVGGLEQIFGNDHTLVRTLKASLAPAKPQTVAIPEEVLAAQRNGFANSRVPAYLGARM